MQKINKWLYEQYRLKKFLANGPFRRIDSKNRLIWCFHCVSFVHCQLIQYIFATNRFWFQLHIFVSYVYVFWYSILITQTLYGGFLLFPFYILMLITKHPVYCICINWTLNYIGNVKKSTLWIMIHISFK